MGEAEAAGSGDDDGGQLERAVTGDEAPEGDGHSILMTGGADDAEEQAVKDHGIEGSDAEDDSGGEGDEADGEIVGHDGAGGERRNADDGLGPHLVALHGGDHLGTEKVAHELGAGGGEHDAEDGAGEHDDESGDDIVELALENARIFVAEVADDGEEVGLAARVDDMVGASQQMIDVLRVAAGGFVLAQDGEVGGDLAVEQGELLELDAGELAEAGGVRLGEERGEAIPVGPALANPLV